MVTLVEHRILIKLVVEHVPMYPRPREQRVSPSLHFPVLIDVPPLLLLHQLFLSLLLNYLPLLYLGMLHLLLQFLIFQLLMLCQSLL